MTAGVLPALPDPGLLADLCREAARRERVEPGIVEKDFYLTRLLWALGDSFGNRLLLKGGTLLSKVDLGFKRMSEDADMVVPGLPHRQKRDNTLQLNKVRDALRELTAKIGLQLRFPDGQSSDRGCHRIWELSYGSQFAPGAITLEVALGPTLLPARKVGLGQLLSDPLVGSYAPAFCFALNAAEARAEKVRAACTREQIRDLYDLDQLAEAGADFTSSAFLKLVDQKLAELNHRSISEQTSAFDMNPKRLRALESQLRRDLAAVLRAGEPPFSIEAALARFERYWSPKRKTSAKR